jgi:hypothetical protein
MQVLANVIPKADVGIMALFAVRKMSRAGFNYFLETRDSNYLALHTSLIMAFEGKTDLFGDFSDEDNLTNNLGEQLMKILENGTKQSFKDSEVAFSDPDAAVASRVTKAFYNAMRIVGGGILSYFFSGLFKLAVPYQTYYIENTPRNVDNFKDVKGESNITKLTREIEKYKILNESAKPQKENEILYILDRILKGDQSPDQFTSYKTKAKVNHKGESEGGPKFYLSFFNKYIEEKTKNIDSMLRRLNAAREEYLSIMVNTEIKDSMKKEEIKEKVDLNIEPRSKPPIPIEKL